MESPAFLPVIIYVVHTYVRRAQGGISTYAISRYFSQYIVVHSSEDIESIELPNTKLSDLLCSELPGNLILEIQIVIE